MTVGFTLAEAVGRTRWIGGRYGLPQPWAPWGRRDADSDEGIPNDCCFGFTWITNDDGGRSRSDYRNGSIKAYIADRHFPLVHRGVNSDGVPNGRFLTAHDVLSSGIRQGDGLLLRWEDTGTPDHIGFVQSVNANGTVNTTEMNTGPSVGVYVPCGVHNRVRYAENIVGAVRPLYRKAA